MITPADVLMPNGDLSPADFPGMSTDDLNTLLTTYIADGYTRCPATLGDTQKDSAAAAWAYMRAFRVILMRLSRTPASVTVANEGSTTILGEQIRTFKTLEQRWELEFDTITSSAPTPIEQPSAAACNNYVW